MKLSIMSQCVRIMNLITKGKIFLLSKYNLRVYVVQNFTTHLKPYGGIPCAEGCCKLGSLYNIAFGFQI